MPDTVLIIDDSQDIHLLLTSILSKRGYHTLSAADGQEGMEKARREQPDLILLDVLMPGMDGLEVCQRLKESRDTKHIPVLFLSAKSDPHDKVKGLQVGGADYIGKPFNKGEVLARVETHLELRRLTKELMQANELLREKQASLDEDLKAAGLIQQNLLPKHKGIPEGVSMSWYFHPSARIGGDIFNYIPLNAKYMAFYILDVSGHRVPSALVAASVSQALQPKARFVVSDLSGSDASVVPPQEVCAALDSEFPMERFDKYFTMFYAVLNMQTGDLSYTSAGHPPAVVHTRNNKLHLLQEGGPFIGLDGALPFEQGHLRLCPGDGLCLYTDGLTEHENDQEEMLGQDRLLDMIRQSGNHEDLPQHLFSLAMHFSSRPAVDDISIYHITFTGLEGCVLEEPLHHS